MPCENESVRAKWNVFAISPDMLAQFLVPLTALGCETGCGAAAERRTARGLTFRESLAGHSISGNFTTIIDKTRPIQRQAGARLDQGVQINNLAFFPQNGND